MKHIMSVVERPLTKLIFCFIAGITVAVLIFGYILQLG